MNEAKKGVMKAALMTFGLTLVATIISGIIVEQFIRRSDEKALALKTSVAAQPPRQVVTTIILPAEEQVTV